MPSPITVGVIANPASGRDIRRLTSYASVFPTSEKANMVVRLLAGLGMLGVTRVLCLRDRTGVAALLLRALDTHDAVAAQQRWPEVEFIEQPITDSVADTHAGVAAMLRAGVELIAVLGGDGTHRAVAAHCGRVPLLTLSTGTNNAFPDLREATVAGLAGALVASGAVPPDVALMRNKRLVVRCTAGPNRGREEIALVDVCVSRSALSARGPSPILPISKNYFSRSPRRTASASRRSAERGRPWSVPRRTVCICALQHPANPACRWSRRLRRAGSSAC